MFTISRFRAAAPSDNSTFLAQRERVYAGMREAGVPEGWGLDSFPTDDDENGTIKIVMTGAASDPPAWQTHIGKRPKARRELLDKRIKKPNDPLKLVIVRDMWLTGFDAPCIPPVCHSGAPTALARRQEWNGGRAACL
jgi:hypothetical protein